MGLRSNLLTATQGEAVVAHRFKDYQPYKGDIERRTNGSLVSIEAGTAIAYSINKLLDRGRFFVEPGEEIYAGQVVGEHTRERDLNINICKTKKLTNVRAAGSDEKIVLPFRRYRDIEVSAKCQVPWRHGRCRLRDPGRGHGSLRPLPARSRAGGDLLRGEPCLRES